MQLDQVVRRWQDKNNSKWAKALAVRSMRYTKQTGGLYKKERKCMKANDRQVGGTHYKDMGVEPWDVVDTWPLEQRIGYYRGGALKYTMRMGTKDECLQEIKKGAHYMQKLIEVLEEQEKEPDLLAVTGKRYMEVDVQEFLK